MKLLTHSVRWAMIVSGLITFTMIYAAIAPHAALQSTFGQTLQSGPITEIVVRSWGTLIALVGFMLVYAAYQPSVRFLVLLVAGLSKLVFVSLMVAQRSHLVQGVSSLPLLLDSLMVILFTTYLVSGVYFPKPPVEERVQTSPKTPVFR